MKRPALEQVLEYAADLREKARENMERDGYLYPTSIIFAMKDPEGRAQRTVLFFLMQNENAAAEVRKLAARVDAYAVMFVMESFMVEPDSSSPAAEVRRIVPSKDPRRRDALWFQVEHEELFGAAIWVARCTKDADGRLHALAFEQWSNGSSDDECEYLESPFMLLPHKRGAAEA